MLDPAYIRDNIELVRRRMSTRGIDLTKELEQLATLESQRRRVIPQLEGLKREQNTAGDEVARAKRQGIDARPIFEANKQRAQKIKQLEVELDAVEYQRGRLLATMPNLPHESVPVGQSASDNAVVRTWGEPRKFDFEPKAHWDLGPALGIIDFERGTKITGSRFYVLSGPGARLQRALIAFMLDLHIRQGYTEQYLPFMVRTATVFGAGQLPKFADNLYKDHEEDLYFVPTAEVPLTGLHMDEILEEAQLPLLYTGYTPCFRREKMSAGRDVRGIKRGHQFDKVEMYMYAKPDESDALLEKMREDAEATCAALGFTYRVKQLCTGDLGFGSAITYDIEVWAPGCNEWLEVSSVSNVRDFQARRANIKYRPADGGKARFLHTLNGSGLGLPRTLIAVLEQYQQADSSIVVPEVLRPWMGGVDVIR